LEAVEVEGADSGLGRKGAKMNHDFASVKHVFQAMRELKLLACGRFKRHYVDD
jgi:hypothetical protein